MMLFTKLLMRLTKLLATQLDLTPAIRSYVEEKLLHGLEKYAQPFDDGMGDLLVEVGKTTHHHKQGDVFRTEANLMLSGHKFRAESVKDDLYASIDDVRDELKRQLTKEGSKVRTERRKGNTLFKKILESMPLGKSEDEE